LSQASSRPAADCFGERGSRGANDGTVFPDVEDSHAFGRLTIDAADRDTHCGRQPTQAHRVRFAQPRAMAMKASDEFTVRSARPIMINCIGAATNGRFGRVMVYRSRSARGQALEAVAPEARNVAAGV